MAEKKIKNDLETDYKLVGIATALKEYKLCFHLNQLLGCDFRKLKELEFEPKDRTRKVQFSVFKAGNEDADLNTFVVFTNRYMGEFLLPEVSNFDYIVQISGKYADEDMKKLVEGIKGFPEIVMTTEIPVKKIRSKERLVYEEEKQSLKLFHPRRFK